MKAALLQAHCNAWPSLPPAVTAAQAVPCSLPAPEQQAGPPSLLESGNRLMFSLLLQPRTGDMKFARIFDALRLVA